MVGGRLVNGSEPEERLEAGQWGAAPVVAEDELVEVDRQVLGRDAVMGALQPGLQVRDRAMRAWQEKLAIGKAGALLTRLVIEACAAQAAVALPAVAVHDRAGGDIRRDELRERSGRCVRQQLQAQPPRALAANLDGDPDQWLAIALAAAPQVGVASAEKALIDLDSPVSGSRSGATIARRSLCRISHAVS